MKLTELRSAQADFRGAASAGPVALIPLGAVEQHSRHLPLGTDALIVEEVAARIEARLPGEVILLPTIPVGASDHHLAMPGSVSVGSAVIGDAAARQFLSIARSSGIRRLLLLNGHGGNQPAVRLALETVHASDPSLQGYGVDYWSLMFDRLDADGVEHPPAMGHADEIETSILLRIRPELVRMDLAAEDGYRDDGMPSAVFSTAGIPDRTAHGGVGNPRMATTERGDRYLTAAVDAVAALVKRIASPI